MNKYKIYCETDNKWEEVISSNVPVSCPVNGSHSVRADSIYVLEEDVKVNDGSLKELTLDDYKELRYNEIDLKTQELISAGFTYDTGAFSLSAHAQLNWSEIHSNQSEFTFPLGISTIDNNEYLLAAANVDAFWTAGKDAVKGHLDSGRSLKKQVFDAVDETAVDAVVDNR